MSPIRVKLLLSIMGLSGLCEHVKPPISGDVSLWGFRSHSVSVECFPLETFSQLAQMCLFFRLILSLSSCLLLLPLSFSSSYLPLISSAANLPSHFPGYFSTTSLERKQMVSPGCETETGANSQSQHGAGLGK